MSRPTPDTVASLLPQLQSDLARLVAIPSVSEWGFPEHTQGRLVETYDALIGLFRDACVRRLQGLELPGTAPILTGEIPGPEGAPTVLLYGHYDVVPAGEDELWESPPFEATERDGAIYGRGTADSKSNLLVHVGALRAWEGKPPVGVKILVEARRRSAARSRTAIRRSTRSRSAPTRSSSRTAARFVPGSPL